MTRCVLLALTFGLFAFAGAPKDGAAKDAKKLEGTWALASAVHDGKKLPADKLEGARLTFEGNHHTVTFGGKTYKGTHKLHPGRKPKAIDISDTEGPFKGKTVLGIYELDGDTFRICYAPPGKERPKDFSAKAGSHHRSHVWKRQKK